MKLSGFLTILMFLLVFSSYAQTNRSFTFPEKVKEYSIAFPQKPVVSQIYKDEIRESWQAQLILQNGLLRAVITSLSPTEVENVWLKGDSELSQIGTDYAKNNGFSNSSVKYGTSKIGKYVVIKGNKQNKDKTVTMEVFFYWGRKESIALTTVTYSEDYPTIEILSFLNSLKSMTPSADLSFRGSSTLQGFDLKTSNYVDSKYPFSIGCPAGWATISPPIPRDSSESIW